MKIESKRDLRLVHRALKEQWNVDKEAIKRALMIALQDPDLAIDAAKCLIVADGIDVKREEQQAKREVKDNELRLRLLELAQSVPVAELTKLASENGIVGRSDQG